MCSFFSCR